MYLTPTKNHWVIDIETDDLNASIIWVACVRHILTKEERTLVGHEAIREFIIDRPDAYWITHNGMGFDVPTLNRLLGVRIPPEKVIDTLLLSMVYCPHLPGGHKLGEWAKRVGMEKIDYHDFTHYNADMATYCMVDVRITAEVWLRLTKRMRNVGFTEVGVNIEHIAWHLIQKQRANGFAFRFAEAHQLYAELRNIQDDLQKRIYEKFPPRLLPVRTFAKSRKINGEPTADFERHQQVYHRLEVHPDGSYTAYDWVDFNIGSPPQRIEKLLELGWVPVERTKPSVKFPDGQPKVTDGGQLVPSLVAFVEESGIEEVALIARWLTVFGRANAIADWLNNYNPKTGAIHGDLWLAGTLRYRSSKPNTQNIPAVRTTKDGHPLRGSEGDWTYEARDLWVHRGGSSRKLVGVDAKGIQLRVLAHYLNDPQFTEAILSEDPHEANKQRMGLASRALTKTITYATLMGAGDPRIAAEAKVPLEEAKAAKKSFFDQVPTLPALIKRLKQELKRTGRIKLCDGTPVIVTSPHMVIPYLLQGDESRIMKLAMIYINRMVEKENLDVLKVGDIHDEHQYDVLIEHIDRFSDICLVCFKKAGRFFKYNLPIECEPKVGETWAETH